MWQQESAHGHRRKGRSRARVEHRQGQQRLLDDHQSGHDDQQVDQRSAVEHTRNVSTGGFAVYMPGQISPAF